MFYHQIFRKNLKGFTLIELLVVIAIIAIISSIVLVNLQGTREKARIAKGLEFSQTVHNVLGVNAIGVWSFEEGAFDTCPGNFDICDASGYGNQGTNNGATWTVERDTPSGKGYALNFDGGNDNINIPHNDSLNVDTITISVWVKPTEDYGAGGAGWIVGKAEDNYSNGEYLLYVDTSGPGKGLIYFWFENTIDGIQQINSDEILPVNTWTYITATYNGSLAKIYFNGVEKRSTSFSGNLNKTKNNLCIGNRCGGDRNFLGLIDEIRIYSQALALVQIQKHYVEGLKRLELAKD